MTARCIVGTLTFAVVAACGSAPVQSGGGVEAPRSSDVTAPVAQPTPVSARGPDEAIDPEPTASPEPPPPPPPDPFPGRTEVTVDELVAALNEVATELADIPAVRTDYEDLVRSHDLADTDALWRDYLRVRLAFESTRDGGLWGLRWDITNKKPRSDEIWAAWDGQGALGEQPLQAATATAECDELSALFAFVARRMGVNNLGLFWPQWNHVVAVWTVPGASGKDVRIVVPTSQIFLTHEDTLGTTGFNPYKQRTIYEYRRKDVEGSHRISAALARDFVGRAREHLGKPAAELQRERNRRSARLGGS